jgi:hypothetical protein
VEVQVVIEVGDENELAAVLLGAEHEGLFGFCCIVVASTCAAVERRLLLPIVRGMIWLLRTSGLQLIGSSWTSLPLIVKR